MLIRRKTARPIRDKLPKPEPEPILLGVIHSPAFEEQELRWVAAWIEQRKPGKVALEIPMDFRQKQEFGVSTFFFGRLVPLSEMSGGQVVPLDHPLLVERAQVISKALELFEEGYSSEEITRDVMRIANSAFYAPPENSASDIARARILAHAYLTVRIGGSSERLTRTWREIMKAREKFMIQRIKEERPSMVVIGDAHARVLHGQLEGYSYERSGFVPEDSPIRRFTL